MDFLPIDVAELPEKLRQHCDPTRPRPARMMAARNIVPLGPSERVTVLYALLTDPDAEVAAAAAQSFASLPDNVLTPALGARLDARILGFVLSRLAESDPRCQVILLNPATPDAAVAEFAPRATPDLADLISQNQQRLMNEPSIIVGLLHNPGTPARVVARLQEWAERQGLGLDDLLRASEAQPTLDVGEGEGEAVDGEGEGVFEGNEEENERALDALSAYEEFEAEAGAEPESVPTSLSHLPAELVALLLEKLPSLGHEVLANLGPDELADLIAAADEGLPDELVNDHPEMELMGDMAPADSDKRESLFQQYAKMTVGRKMLAAQKGNINIRRLLVRDTNKVVLLALVNSPRITEGEAENMAGNRSMPSDVIRLIARNPEWQRSYKLRHNLIYNPKTDFKTALKFVQQLNPRDLRDLAKSKNVPQNVLSHARKLFQARNTRKRG